jgi:hypothetical protein
VSPRINMNGDSPRASNGGQERGSRRNGGQERADSGSEPELGSPRVSMISPRENKFGSPRMDGIKEQSSEQDSPQSRERRARQERRASQEGSAREKQQPDRRVQERNDSEGRGRARANPRANGASREVASNYETQVKEYKRDSMREHEFASPHESRRESLEGRRESIGEKRSPRTPTPKKNEKQYAHTCVLTHMYIHACAYTSTTARVHVAHMPSISRLAPL